MTNSSISSKWNDVCNQVVSYDDVDGSQFSALIERVEAQVMGSDFLLLTTENSFLKNWVEKNFMPYIKRALLDLYGTNFNVLIEIDESQTSQEGSASSQTYAQNSSETLPSARSSSTPLVDNGFQVSSIPSPSDSIKERNSFDQSPASMETSIKSDSGPSKSNDPMASSLTFENFVIGESNNMAYSMAVSVADDPGNRVLNPLFIYGKSGLGKTHLMRAIQNYINVVNPQLTTIYVDAEELISDYTDAVAAHDKEKSSYKNFKDHYESADVLLIDDVQFLQGKRQTLDIVFQIFNKLTNQGKQIVLSADRAPKNIDIDERYSSRFMTGGIVDIQPPEVETKLAIVKSYINEYKLIEGNEHLNVPENIQMYIAENSGSNIRELKGAITFIIYHINVSKDKELTINDVSEILKTHFSGHLSKNLTIDDIQKEIESYYKIKHSDLVGTSRASKFVYPRQMGMYLCRQLLDLPFNDIAQKFNKDHSTAMHSVAKIENMVMTSRDTQEEVETLKKIIKDL